MFKPVDEQLALIKRGIVDLIPEEELVDKLTRSLKKKKPLQIKLGCDPSRPDLHLGHTVVLRKLKAFQDLGHEVTLVIGDFTGMIGDPSGRNKTRPSLTLEETRKHGQSYFEQATKILDPKKTRIVYNSDWLSKMDFSDVINLASRYTVAQMLERDEFDNRFQKGEPISVHEFLYPLAQAMDSVHLRSDVELGGTDQKFNLLVGRVIQREYGQEPQVIITTPLIEGTDGIQKMSKSFDNYIGINDPPEEMFGKTMSIPDELILKYFECTTEISDAELEEVKRTLADPKTNPSTLKRSLGRELVTLYHDAEAAQQAEAVFNRIHVKKGMPEEIPEWLLEIKEPEIWIIKLLSQTRLASSNKEARRFVEQGSVSIDMEKITDPNTSVRLDKDFILKVGKRNFLKVKVKS